MARDVSYPYDLHQRETEQEIVATESDDEHPHEFVNRKQFRLDRKHPDAGDDAHDPFVESDVVPRPIVDPVHRRVTLYERPVTRVEVEATQRANDDANGEHVEPQRGVAQQVSQQSPTRSSRCEPLSWLSCDGTRSAFDFQERSSRQALA